MEYYIWKSGKISKRLSDKHIKKSNIHHIYFMLTLQAIVKAPYINRNYFNIYSKIIYINWINFTGNWVSQELSNSHTYTIPLSILIAST